jgi:mono/diheme cytochrome c family protein
MSTLIFVLIWVVLGIGLLLVAFSGGPSGAGKRLMSTGRVARRVSIVLFAVLALVLGVLVPAAVIAAVSNRDDIPEANVSDLTASEQSGRELFGQRCANCHTLKAANAIASVGPNLDELRPNKALVLDAIENGRADGDGQMAAGLFAGQDAEDVANFVSKAVGQTETGGGEGESGGEESGSGGEEGGSGSDPSGSGGEEGGSGGGSGGEEGGSGGGSGGEEGGSGGESGSSGGESG